MSHVSLTDLRKRMAFYFDKAVDDREPIIVTRPPGRGDVVVVSAEEFSALEETVHLLSSPANAARLLASVQQARSGNTQERDLIEPAVTIGSR